ncbi:MAG: DUF1684 domain-containing protein [Flavobacteriaceae bacterium]
MKNAFALVFIGLMTVIVGCKDAKRYHDEMGKPMESVQSEALLDIAAFQEELNAQFRDADSSPLPDRYRKDFEGLDFFEVDTNFRVMAQLERTPDALPFLMPTTTERKSTERVFGIARFRLGQREFQLEVYQSPDLEDSEEYEDYLFLPFTDKTNGKTTYSGGRYIDLVIPEGESILIDFNKAYNPFCVYNKKYSCPLVPVVNHLEVEVKAGVKMFHKKES